jgi:AcrR family transcriptional regulator
VSTATFYNFFPSRGAMFTEVFRELVLGSLEEEPLVYAAVDAGHFDTCKGIESYLRALYAASADRTHLIRGALQHRLETPPPVVSWVRWLEGYSGGDIALEIAHDILTLLFLAFGEDPDPFIAVAFAAQALALYVLDLLSVGTEQEPSLLAEIVTRVLLSAMPGGGSFDRPVDLREQLLDWLAGELGALEIQEFLGADDYERRRQTSRAFLDRAGHMTAENAHTFRAEASERLLPNRE